MKKANLNIYQIKIHKLIKYKLLFNLISVIIK